MTQSHPVRLALIGISGYGEVHLENIRRLENEGIIDFVGAADPVPPFQTSYAATTRYFESALSSPVWLSDLESC